MKKSERRPTIYISQWKIELIRNLSFFRKERGISGNFKLTSLKGSIYKRISFLSDHERSSLVNQETNYYKADESAPNSENLMGNLLKNERKQSIKKNYVPMGYLDLDRRPLLCYVLYGSSF